MSLAATVARWWHGVTRRDHPANPSEGFINLLAGGEPTIAGEHVSPLTAMMVAGVFCAVSIRAAAFAAPPLQLFKRLPDGGRELATDHPVYRLVGTAPNDEMNSYEWREYLQVCQDLRGNAYCELFHNDNGILEAIVPIPPDRVTVKRENHKLQYYVRDDAGKQVPKPYGKIMHLRGLSIDGVLGASPITLHRETIARAGVQAKYASYILKNAARPSGAFKHPGPGPMSDIAYERLKKDLEERYTGAKNAGRPFLLEENTGWQQLGMSNEDLQYVESYKLTLLDICRIFQIPPHMLFEMDHATFSNIEEQMRDFYSRTLMAIIVRAEYAFNRWLLKPEEQAQYFFKFNMSAFLRGKDLDRFQVYALARQWGILNINEIRELEERNNIGPEGDIHLEPLNMVPAGTEREPSDDKTSNPQDEGAPNKKKEPPNKPPGAQKKREAPEDDGSDDGFDDLFEKRAIAQLKTPFLAIFQHELSRSVSKECLVLRKKIARQTLTAEEFRSAAASFYSEHAKELRKVLEPSVIAYRQLAGLPVEHVSYPDYYSLIARDAIHELFEHSELPIEAIEARLDEWLADRPVEAAYKLLSYLEREVKEHAGA